MQGLDVPASVDRSMLEATVVLDASGRARVGYVHVLAGEPAEATEHFDACVADVPAVFAAAEAAWDKALADAFDPAGDGFSGSLPILRPRTTHCASSTGGAC